MSVLCTGLLFFSNISLNIELVSDIVNSLIVTYISSCGGVNANKTKSSFSYN